MGTELNPEDRERIEQEAKRIWKDFDNQNRIIPDLIVDMGIYATKYEREQQAKEIEKLKELLRTAEGALRFAGLERTADVIEKALNE